MENCKHLATKGKDNENGSWCIDCGLKIYDVDINECQYCKHFKKLKIDNHTMCTKLLMAVLPDMHVTFKIVNGTCFEKAN